MPLAHFYQGKRHPVVTFLKNGSRDEVTTFLNGLQKPQRAKMVALLHLAANEGPPYNRSDRCRRLQGEEFSEFKTHDYRILWFMDDRTIVLMTAFEKRQQKTPQGEIARARNAMATIVEELRGTGGSNRGS